MPREQVLAVLQKHLEEIRAFGVSSLRLFGSVARGDDVGGSDVDLLVDFATTPTFSRYMKLRIFLEDLLGTQVDLVTENGLKESVRGYVEQEAIRVA